ncbi:proteasome-activating nucleotidase [Methanosphaerula palustris]|uniref:26S proteasome subunit P45 family n=1 Tax=Methanosphaerula palustris (strain ATCC BAA-1556 / DSM 19958 / E1-9c) TaxID=521011 RepID=B8GKJ7_METPE|nr:proteasome-activating nucleotidase [Methanosphaerula palustris]ACL15880.1 26S proteasome subunit P45 family [Methanosphaerula palustris E1-9c]
MDDTIINSVNAGSELNYQIELQQIEAQFLELKMRFDTLQKENAHLKKENNQLKRMPLFVAVVVDMLGDGVIYLRQQGNNQEYLTHIDEDLYRTLKPGTKVAVNNSLSVVRVVGNIFDARIRVMELDSSPDVSFDQIGGLAEQIEEVREAVEYPLTRPEIFLQVGVEPPKGILLHGSPGTGKTLIAKAVAHEAKATFIRMSGSELVHKFIGEGAQLVRELFTLARERAPSIIFIDEIDAVGSIRTNDGTSGSAEVQRTMMQLLAEMDGFNNRGDVRIMAATNRVDMLDPALLRPGRFDRVIEIPLPDKGSRRSILSIHSRNMTLSNVDIDLLAEMTETFTGAELQSVCREAGMMAVRKKASAIEQQDFIAAIRKIRTDPATDERMFT